MRITVLRRDEHQSILQYVSMPFGCDAFGLLVHAEVPLPALQRL